MTVIEALQQVRSCYWCVLLVVVLSPMFLLLVVVLFRYLVCFFGVICRCWCACLGRARVVGADCAYFGVGVDSGVDSSVVLVGVMFFFFATGIDVVLGLDMGLVLTFG